MDRPDPRSRQRPELRLDDRLEGHQLPQGSGLRLRRHVLWRPDLEARQLKLDGLRPRRNAPLLPRPALAGEGVGGLNDFLYKVTKRHIPGFGMWRLIVLAGRDNKTATF